MEGTIGRGRLMLRFFLTLLYGGAGWFHLNYPVPFIDITPGIVPWPAEMVYLTGIAEIAGAIALWIPKLRKAAGVGLALYALCVWPANINHMLIDMHGGVNGDGTGTTSLYYHIPRQFMQPVLVWAALWCTRVVDWPWRKRKG